MANDLPNFVEDQELNPITFTKQFTTSNLVVSQTLEEVLWYTRMILATELGKDPLLQQSMQDLFRTKAQISVMLCDSVALQSNVFRQA